MKLRFLPVLAAAAALLGACTDDPTGLECNPTSLQQVGVQGDTVTLSTGVRFVQVEAGAGPEVEWCKGVAVYYTGFVLGDTVPFDDSRARDQKLGFVPGEGALIPGFEQGVVGMKVGGRRNVIIPPELGYGAQPRYDQAGRIVIPANSTLVFDIEVAEVEGS